MEWRFKKLTKDDTLLNPSHLEFFHNDALKSAVDALAREDIQNRLDARRKNQDRVEIRYRLCGPVSPNQNSRWFHGLKNHLDSTQTAEELGYKPSLDNSLYWIVAEDFNTTGLEGDPLCYQDPEAASSKNEKRNDFFWFIRNVGRSGKMGKDRGRWGLGKIVYPAASLIRSFFAYSIRASDQKRSLIGRSVLAVHRVDGSFCDSEGYFGRYEDTSYPYFATPESNNAELDSFADDFNLTRKNDEPGLSLVIPWPANDISADDLIISVIEHWFWVILEGRLLVKVTLDASNEETIISNETISDVIEKKFGTEAREMLRKIDFAKSVQDYDPRNTTPLMLSNSKNAPKWDRAEDRFPTSEKLLEIQNNFLEGHLVSFDIPIRVQKNDGNVDESASFELYLKKNEDGAPAVETFLRDGLTISGQQFLREPGVYALIKSGDNALGTLLGDAENPSHTKWERDGKHFRGKYVHGPAILTYVQRSAQNLCSLLCRRPEGVDQDLLKNIFSVSEKHEGKTIGGKKGKKGGKVVKRQIKQKNFYIQCTKHHGGFTISKHPEATKTPFGIRIVAAYEIDRGNALDHYDPADFNFELNSGVLIEYNGFGKVTKYPNKIIAEINKDDFELTISGFDPNRDLLIDARVIHDLKIEIDQNDESDEDEQEN
jgi:hypothetical protein